MIRYPVVSFMIASLLLLLGMVLSISCSTTMPDADHDTPPVNQNAPLGTNLRNVEDWSTDWPFVDAFKRSTPWIPQRMGVPDTGEAALIDLDAQGWVRSLPAPDDLVEFEYVSTLLFRGLHGHYPAGEYIVLYEGEGAIEYGFDATLVAEVAPQTGRHVLNVLPSDAGIRLRITATDPNQTGNYIRNIRVLMPGFEATYATQIFHPVFLEKIQPYKALRFMAWMRTNNSIQGVWADRPQVEDARYSTSAGVPLEIMIALSNRLHADPWFSMPHMATDEYVTEFATLVRETLDPARQVYVEYSNEVWNAGFCQPGLPLCQFDWVTQQAVTEWQGIPGSFALKRANWFGKRTAEICDLWKNGWGAQRQRVTCVMSAQASNVLIAQRALACTLWEPGSPCANHQIDALAIAPYFGNDIGDPLYATQVISWTLEADGGLDKLFTELTTGGILTEVSALQEAYTDIQDHLQVAATYTLPLIAYEGGQHLVVPGGPDNPAITQLFIAANRDARMGELYTQYLNQWKALGGQLFVHNINIGEYNRNGSFGALEYLDQSGSPKYDALMSFMQNNPCWWPEDEFATIPPLGNATCATPTATVAPTVTLIPTALPTSTPTATATPPKAVTQPAVVYLPLVNR